MSDKTFSQTYENDHNADISKMDTIYRQAAIELAMQYCPDDDGSCSKADRDIRELLDDLENLPPAQPDLQPTCNNLATDTISRQAAIDVMCSACWDWCDEGVCKRVSAIQEIPSAQPEIIHCRNCRWRKDQSGSTEWLPCRAIVTPSDFYCGRAERRTDERSD